MSALKWLDLISSEVVTPAFVFCLSGSGESVLAQFILPRILNFSYYEATMVRLRFHARFICLKSGNGHPALKLPERSQKRP